MTEKTSIRIAASADFHCDKYLVGRDFLAGLSQKADLLLLAGDITHSATSREIDSFMALIEGVQIPVLLVWGNHDVHMDRQAAFYARFAEMDNLTVLEGASEILSFGEFRIGITGLKGHGGGFPPYRITRHGERCARIFMEEQEEELAKLRAGLEYLDSEKPDLKICLMHYVPFEEGLGDEPRELYILLGASRFGDLLRKHQTALTIFGHAHHGSAGLLNVGEGLFACNAGYHVNQQQLCLFDYNFTTKALKLAFQ